MMNSLKLNNDAVKSIQAEQYRKATLILNRALLVSKYGVNHCNSTTTDGQQESLSVPGGRSDDCYCVLEKQGQQQEETQQETQQEDIYDEGMDALPEPYSIPSSKANSNEFIKVVLFYNLGIAYLRMGNNEDALAYFEKALSEHTALSMHNINSSGVSTVCSSFNTQEMIALLHNLGHSYFRCRRYNESLTIYNKAFDLSLQTYGYYHVSVSTTLNCIGVVRLHSLGDCEYILGVFTEALAINEAISTCSTSTSQFNNKSQLLLHQQAVKATILNNIGRVRFARKEYHEAKRKYEESHKIRLEIYGPIHIDVAAVLNNIGEAQQMLGNSNDAILKYQKFLGIKVKLGRRDYDVAATFKKIGHLYCERGGDFSYKAIEMYLKALDIVKSCLGETHTEVAIILNKIGSIFYQCQEYNIALKVYEKVLRLEQQILERHNPNIFTTTINIARIHHPKWETSTKLL